jgi:Protein of unknown function (DUF2846)
LDDMPASKLLLLTTSIALIAGCATVPSDAPRFSPAPAPPEGYATLYIYRLGAPPLPEAIKISVNGQPVLQIPERGYTWLHVRAGTYAVLGEWPRTAFGLVSGAVVSATPSVDAGKSYYFRVTGNVSPTFGGLLVSKGIAQRPPEAGAVEINACCSYMRSATERMD